jgi:hypothetical protein
VAIVNIDPEFQECIPKLRKEEYAQLEVSLQREGCRDPLRLWGNLLVDGHNRYEICKRLNIPFGITRLDLDSREDALQWIRRNQLARRNVTDAYRKILTQKIAEGEAKLSRKNQHKSLAPENGGETSKKRTQDRVAKEHGVSKHSLEQAKIINDAAEKNPEGAAVLAKVRDGEITSLSAAVKMVKPEAPKKRKGHQTPEAQNRRFQMGLGALTGTYVGIGTLDIALAMSKSTEKEIRHTLDALEDIHDASEKLTKQVRKILEARRFLLRDQQPTPQWTAPQIIETKEGLAIH